MRILLFIIIIMFTVRVCQSRDCAICIIGQFYVKHVLGWYIRICYRGRYVFSRWEASVSVQTSRILVSKISFTVQ